MEEEVVMNKWYVRCNSAEEDSYAIVQLSEAEYKAVVKFLSAPLIFGGGYAGTCYIINHPFNTKEEALEAITTDTIWLYSE